MKQNYKVFAWLFTLTGIFAFVGGIFSWGRGWIIDQTELINVQIQWADILLTTPLSIIGGLGLYRNRNWARKLCTANAGIYIFGSFLVFTEMFWNGIFPILFIVPALSGLAIGVFYLRWILSGQQS